MCIVKRSGKSLTKLLTVLNSEKWDMGRYARGWTGADLLFLLYTLSYHKNFLPK